MSDRWRYRSRIVMLFFLALILTRAYCGMPVPAADPPASRGGSIALIR